MRYKRSCFSDFNGQDQKKDILNTFFRKNTQFIILDARATQSNVGQPIEVDHDEINDGFDMIRER
jgi:hypothetical protein